MANTGFFAIAYPMANKSGAGEYLRQFIHEYGRSEKPTFDSSQKWKYDDGVYEERQEVHNRLSHNRTLPIKPQFCGRCNPRGQKEVVSSDGSEKCAQKIMGLWTSTDVQHPEPNV
jgi:hypothetical protein